MKKTTILIISSAVTLSAYLSSVQETNSNIYKASDMDRLINRQYLNEKNLSESVETNILDLKTFRQASIDGSLKVDEQGNLVVDRNLRHWFDFYLSAVGEISLENIVKLMVDEIKRLPMPAHHQAMMMLQNYLAYKEELAEYEQREALSTTELSSLSLLSDRLDWQKRLRRQWFEEDVVIAFWQMDEVIDDYAQKKLLISTLTISEEEKQHQLLLLEKDLPNEYIEYRKNLDIAGDLLSSEKRLKQEFTDSVELSDKLHQLRSELVGEEASQRLMDLDKLQDNWKSRITAYQAEKYRIDALQGISEQDKVQLVISYERDNFDEKEILRLSAALQLLGTSQVN